MDLPCVIVTPLPNGLEGGAGRLSALLTPQLGNEAFGHGPFERWPETLCGKTASNGRVDGTVEFILRWQGGPDPAADRTNVPVLSAQVSLDLQLWTEIFSNIDQPKLQDAPQVPKGYVSTPHGSLLNIQKIVYGKVAEAKAMAFSPPRLGAPHGDAVEPPPAARTLLDEADQIKTALSLYLPPFAPAKDRDEAQTRFDEVSKAAASAPPEKAGFLKAFNVLKGDGRRLPTRQASEALATEWGIQLKSGLKASNAPVESSQAAAVALRTAVIRAARAGARPLGAVAQPRSFDRIVAGLASFPQLYRALGLVADLTIPPQVLAQLAVLGDDQKFLWLTPRTPASWKNVKKVFTSHMAFELDGAAKQKFVCRGRVYDDLKKRPFIEGGVVDLGNQFKDEALFELQTSDVTGLHEKLTRQQDAAAQAADHGTFADTSSLPADRSVGMELCIRKRGEFFNLLNSATSGTQTRKEEIRGILTNGKDPVLYADDVVLGYRIDVWDGTSKKWHSLCERTGTYRIGPVADRGGFEWKPAGQDPEREEGMIRLGATSMDDPNKGHVLEAMFRWDNWSLAVPFRGRVHNKETAAKTVEDLVRVKAHYEVKAKTCPRLRYGRKYRFRCRFVDAAGNSHRLSDFGDEPAGGFPQGGFLFSRAEPVGAPVVALAEVLDPWASPGEQLARMVVREGSPAIATRYAVAPRVTFGQAEKHGMFDRGTLPGALSGIWLRREDGALPTVEEFLVDTGRRPLADASATKNAMVIFDEQLEHSPPREPYFADPFARHATPVITDENGKAVSIPDPFDFFARSRWPEPAPFRVELRHGPASMSDCVIARWRWPRDLYDGTESSVATLEITIRKWEMLRLTLRCGFGLDGQAKDRVAQMWLSSLWQANARSGAQIEAGHHDMYSPPREITLVHAGRTPPRPALKITSVEKTKEGETSALVKGACRIAAGPTAIRKCAATVSITAGWTDLVDDPRKPGPDEQTRGGQVLHAHVERKAVDASTVPFEIREEFRDTRYRLVHYVPTITSAHQEYFTDAKSGDFHSTGDPTDDQIVPSSARPAPPVVLDVVPAFRWTPTDAGFVRHAGGLRVYLDRPWYSSGAGEKLAVILAAPQPAGAAEAAPLYRDLVSHWGGDPIWKSRGALLTEDLRVSDFIAAGEVACGHEKEATANLAEFESPDPPKSVTVLPYTPIYEPRERRWYCDIEIRPGDAYFPHVRLALARYQKNSLKDLELSRVVRADFAQLAPERDVRVVPAADGKIRVTVTGQQNASNGTTRTTSMLIRLEEGRAVSRESIEGWMTARDPQGHEISQVVPGDPRNPGKWTIDLPRPRCAWPLRQRIVVEEYETFLADLEDDASKTKTCGRLVFAAAVAL